MDWSNHRRHYRLAPNYATTAASIGGGSAGTVPFDLHGTDSTPVDGSSVALGSVPSATSPIRIRHYGPINYAFGEIPVTITAESNYPCPGGACVDFTACIIPTFGKIARDAANNTILVITPPDPSVFEFLSGYTYRVRPVRSGAAVLNCSIASPVPVADWEYDFCVGTVDAADITGDGSINIADFNVVASRFGHTGCPIQGDVNADGNISIGDFNIVASKFGATGIGTCNSASLMRGDGGENDEMARLEGIVEKMGFENLDDFWAWLETLSEKEQLDVMVELISRLGE